MDPNRRQRLEALPGWVWTHKKDRWEEGFANLKQFSDREGHCLVSKGYKTDNGYPLGAWVLSQSKSKIHDPDRRQRLEALPGWSWPPEKFGAVWEQGFATLKQFSDRHGHSRVTFYYETEDGFRLGRWVNRQRIRQNRMEPDRRQRLEALPGWSWRPESEKLERLGKKTLRR